MPPKTAEAITTKAIGISAVMQKTNTCARLMVITTKTAIRTTMIQPMTCFTPASCPRPEGESIRRPARAGAAHAREVHRQPRRGDQRQAQLERAQEGVVDRALAARGRLVDHALHLGQALV